VNLNPVEPSHTEPGLAEYLGQRRALPGLVELSPRHLALLDDCVAVRTVVAASGEPAADLRLLLDDGERYLVAATDLANTLGCDVYLTPHGASVRYERESNPVSGDSWDAVAVDRVTGAPTGWLTVRPADLPPALPTWFVSLRGRLRPATGLVTTALPNGTAFATRASFRTVATVAARLATRADGVLPGLSTVLVGADLGRFEIARFNDAGSLLGGVDFATLVAASLDVLEPDLQLALAWPASSAAGISLDCELMRLADALDRTVWVPAQGAAAVVAREEPVADVTAGAFAALDAGGAPVHWYPYRSRLAVAGDIRYGTDRSGRLVPLAGVDPAALLLPPRVAPARPRIEVAPARPRIEVAVARPQVGVAPVRPEVEPSDHEIVHWPEADVRADTPAYLVLPGAQRAGFVALSRTRPPLAAGQQVLEVKLRRRLLIDVPATVAAQGDAPELAAVAGDDLVLPAADLPRAVVTKVWWYGADGQPMLTKLDRGTLADHVRPAEVDAARTLELVGAR
jgi:hypothetical protein